MTVTAVSGWVVMHSGATMRMQVEAPPGWHATDSGFSSPDGAITVELGPIRGPAELDPRRWFERDLAPTSMVEYLEVATSSRTRDGWELTLALMRIDEGALRLGAIYAISPWTGVAMVRVSADRFEQEQPMLVALLAAARPNLWRDEPACVAELFWEDTP